MATTISDTEYRWRTVIGIDPGLAGGVARIHPGLHDTGYGAIPMPDCGELFEILSTLINNTRPVVFIEKVNAGPKMGSSAAFKFGQNVGMIRACCIAAGVRMEYVTPQKWQRELGLIVSGRGLGQNDTAKKNRNKARAQELFPGIKITHAIADALLIAEYGRRQLNGGSDGDRPIWDRIAELAESLPEEAIEQLPTDGASEHDHYLYGTPKRKVSNG